jgi:hypothetical protein
MSSNNGTTWVSNNVTGGTLPFNQFQTPVLINTTTSNAQYLFRARVYKNCFSQRDEETISERFTPPVIITVFPQVTVAISSNLTPACLSSTGGINLSSTFSGGTVLSYKWKKSDGSIVSVNSSYSPTLPDSYQLQVIMTNGCTALSNIINVYTSPVVSIINASPVCLSASLSLNSNITGVAPANFNWQLNGTSINPIINSPNFSPVTTAGTYQLIVSSANGCTGTSNQIIVLPIPAVTITSSISAICFGAPTILSANVVQTPPSANYNYEWSKDGVIQSNTNANFTINQPGNYDVKVTNSDGCTATSSVLNITQSSSILFNAPYSINVAANTPFVLGNNPLVNGGASPYTYDWSQTGVSFSSIQNPTISGITANSIYNVLVTDNNLCSISQNYSVNIVTISVTSYTNSYAVLKKQLDAGYYQVQNGKLFFKFQEEYKNISQLNYKIYDEHRSNVLLTPPTLPVKIGTNQYFVDLTSYGSFVNSSYYTIEVQNEKKEKFVLKFKYDQ